MNARGLSPALLREVRARVENKSGILPNFFGRSALLSDTHSPFGLGRRPRHRRRALGAPTGDLLLRDVGDLFGVINENQRTLVRVPVLPHRRRCGARPME
jgi:hypothetical protein